MVYEERMKERKGRDSVDGATARTEKIEGGVGGSNNSSGGVYYSGRVGS